MLHVYFRKWGLFLQTQPTIGIIIGSNRPERIGGAIGEWVQTALHAGETPLFTTKLIDLAQVALPFLDEPAMPALGHYQQAYTMAWSREIQACAGFVLVYPQYNWGYPAVLKNALDYLYAEWAHKPVSQVVYGHHGGFQAQLALSLVTKGLHMVSMDVNPSINIQDPMFAADGQFRDIQAALQPGAAGIHLLAEEFNALIRDHAKNDQHQS
ncbi:SPCC4B3.06c [Schleiferilactobacillus shenzhenensis LY-73]|uniref:SPCC4B3.06c n=1 Tax=Schleiferilactobacillus shenzhenensis LY-73 TaxID=1231336 RepID=U4TLM6_9LACO|nr:SPCC4B3.06c [Schleiferilactobacillus shenzhenensis LY-73]